MSTRRTPVASLIEGLEPRLFLSGSTSEQAPELSTASSPQPATIQAAAFNDQRFFYTASNGLTYSAGELESMLRNRAQTDVWNTDGSLTKRGQLLFAMSGSADETYNVFKFMMDLPASDGVNFPLTGNGGYISVWKVEPNGIEGSSSQMFTNDWSDFPYTLNTFQNGAKSRNYPGAANLFIDAYKKSVAQKYRLLQNANGELSGNNGANVWNLASHFHHFRGRVNTFDYMENGVKQDAFTQAWPGGATGSGAKLLKHYFTNGRNFITATVAGQTTRQFNVPPGWYANNLQNPSNNPNNPIRPGSSANTAIFDVGLFQGWTPSEPSYHGTWDGIVIVAELFEANGASIFDAFSDPVQRAGVGSAFARLRTKLDAATYSDEWDDHSGYSDADTLHWRTQINNEWNRAGIQYILNNFGRLVAAPSGLTAGAVSSSQINLSWTDNATNETGYEIDRATNSSFTSGLTTVTVGANVTSYSATGLSAGTNYYFRVRGTVGGSNDSPNSGTASATTQAAAGVLIAGDGFGGTVGSALNGSAGGSGFGGGWTADPTFTHASGSLAYADGSGRSLSTSGNKASQSTTSSYKQATRLVNVTGRPEVWYSILFNAGTTQFDLMPFSNGYGTGPVIRGTGTNLIFQNAAGAASKTGTNLAYAAGTNLLVVRLRNITDADGNGEFDYTMDLYLNPTNLANVATSSTTRTWSAIDGMLPGNATAVRNATSNPTNWSFDEIRLGTSVNAVTPFTGGTLAVRSTGTTSKKSKPIASETATQTVDQNLFSDFTIESDDENKRRRAGSLEVVTL